MNNRIKRKQCCKCRKTFFEPKLTYVWDNDSSFQSMMDGDYEPDYQVEDKRLCPHCDHNKYIIV